MNQLKRIEVVVAIIEESERIFTTQREQSPHR